METIQTPPPLPPVKKPSQVIAWLGFGISLGVLLVFWAVLTVLYIRKGDSNVVFPVLMLTLPILGLLGLMGLVFSIVGLVMANRHSLRKAPSVWGIVFCDLSLLSLIIPFVIAVATRNNSTKEINRGRSEEPVIEEVETHLTAWDTGNTEQDNVLNDNVEDVAVAAQKNVVMLHVTDMYELKCYDNRKKVDNHPAVINLLDYDKQHDFKTWLQVKGIGKADKFVIKVDQDIDYSYVVETLDMLKASHIPDYNYKLLD